MKFKALGNLRIVASLLVVLPTIAGCGGSNDVMDTAAPLTSRASAPDTASADPDRPMVLAFGDSLTAGHRVDAAMSYPSQLMARLQEAGYDYQVVNDGESGLTTSGGLARLDRALALEPEIVVLALGGNDGLRGTPIPVAHENLRTMIRAFSEQGATVVLGGITLPRNYGPDYISEFESMYLDLAREFEIGFIPFFLEGLVDLENPLDGIGTTMQDDGIHPTAHGYTIVAETVFEAIEPYLARTP